MGFLPQQIPTRWVAAGLMLAIGLIVVRQSVPSVTATAEAAGAMSAIDRLIAEDDIRQQIALYGLYADGDGLERRNPRKLADQIMTADVINEIYPVTGPITEMKGRDPVVGPPRPPGVVGAPPAPTAGRHYMVSTYFDQITPTEARTRTTAVHFDMTKNLVGPDCKKSGEDACGGRVVKGSMWVYHTIWAKTADGWQMTANRLRNDN